LGDIIENIAVERHPNPEFRESPEISLASPLKRGTYIPPFSRGARGIALSRAVLAPLLSPPDPLLYLTVSVTIGIISCICAVNNSRLNVVAVSLQETSLAREID
jgi:hypothetical protein